jgi:hypothetical protein
MDVSEPAGIHFATGVVVAARRFHFSCVALIHNTGQSHGEPLNDAETSTILEGL